MKDKSTRKYSMDTRTAGAEKSKADILKVLGQLWLQHPLHEITLEKIAEAAGVTVRTVLRKFGSKEALLSASLDTDITGIQGIKDQAEPGNIEQAVATLMMEYESTGIAALRILAAENELPFAAEVLKVGREMHRKWCLRIFGQFLPDPSQASFAIYLGAFYAATDINKWKLLRIDLGFTVEETSQIFVYTLLGLISTIKS